MIKVYAFYANVANGSLIARHSGAIQAFGGYLLPVELKNDDGKYLARMPYQGGKLIVQIEDGVHENRTFSVAGLHGEKLFPTYENGNHKVFSTMPDWETAGLLVGCVDSEGELALIQIIAGSSIVYLDILWSKKLLGNPDNLLKAGVPGIGLRVLTAAWWAHKAHKPVSYFRVA